MYASKKNLNKSKSRVNDLSFSLTSNEPTIKPTDHIKPLAAMKSKPITTQQPKACYKPKSGYYSKKTLISSQKAAVKPSNQNESADLTISKPVMTDEFNIDDKIDLKIYRIIEERVEKRLSRMQNDIFRLQAQVDELLANRNTAAVVTPVLEEFSFDDSSSVTLVDVGLTITNEPTSTTTTTISTEPIISTDLSISNEPTDLNISNEPTIKLKPLQLKQT